MPPSKTSRAAKQRGSSIFNTETFVFILILSGIAVVIPALYFTSPAIGRSEPASPRPPLSLDSTRNSYNQILPYIQYAWSLSFRSIPYFFAVPIYFARVSYRITLRFFRPAFFIFDLAALVFAPVTIVVQALISTFIIAPYNWLTWFAGVLYPIYVFCGIAFLVGAGMGGGAALFPQVLLRAYAGLKKLRENAEEEGEEPVRYRYVRVDDSPRNRRWEDM